MKFNRLIFIWLFTLCLGCQHAQVSNVDLKASSEFGNFTQVESAAQVVLIPQWHLSPQTNSKLSKQNIPQSENQISIYRQLSEWVASKNIHNVIVEGCEGEVGPEFMEAFNGWTMQDLNVLSHEQLESALAHIGMKLKTRFPNLKVICGDNLELIRKHQLALSDLRGLFGFKLRIAQYKNNPEKRKSYLKKVQEILKLPSKSTEEAIMKDLNQALQAALQNYENLILERNKHFIKAIEAQKNRTAAVIGAMHVPDLNQELQKDRFIVGIFKPNGLGNMETELDGLIEQVKKAILDDH